MTKLLNYVALGLVLTARAALADDITIKVRAIDGNGAGKEIGTIRAVDTEKGLMLVPRLSDLKPGVHGFHVHANPNCGPKGTDGRSGPGLGAGGHFDPERTGKHEGPSGKGHLGDLPALTVDESGTARKPVTAPRLEVADLRGRAIVIHEGGDNYADQPKELGGGGGRVACAVVAKAQGARGAKERQKESREQKM